MLGLVAQAGSWMVAIKLVGIWLLVLLGSATASQMMARVARREGERS